jgi:NIMA (never in mitosis gene a)-related kinase
MIPRPRSSLGRLVTNSTTASSLNFTNSTAETVRRSAEAAQVGSKLADFKIISELGKGSYGVVFKVQSLIDKAVYVMKKICIKHMKAKQQHYALKEAQILKRVQHPCIIRYYNSFAEDENLYIIMEFAEGGDLHAVSFHIM